jgi:ComF family protein
MTPPHTSATRLSRFLTGTREIASAALELLLPGVCLLCETPLGRDAGPACSVCWSRIARLPQPQCARCGHPRTSDDPCRWCDPLPPYIRAVRSVAWMQRGTAPELLHALKYDGWSALADGMAHRMAVLPWPADVLQERACLVPVPVTPARRRERGYNQAELLAAGLARRWQLPVAHALVRTKAVRSQTRLTPGERQANVARVFSPSAPRPAVVAGAHCILVDDVVTTAATLSACAAALLDGGARIVSCVTFGRAPATGDRLTTSG